MKFCWSRVLGQGLRALVFVVYCIVGVYGSEVKAVQNCFPVTSSTSSFSMLTQGYYKFFLPWNRKSAGVLHEKINHHVSKQTHVFICSNLKYCPVCVDSTHYLNSCIQRWCFVYLTASRGSAVDECQLEEILCHYLHHNTLPTILDNIFAYLREDAVLFIWMCVSIKIFYVPISGGLSQWQLCCCICVGV